VSLTPNIFCAAPFMAWMFSLLSSATTAFGEKLMTLSEINSALSRMYGMHISTSARP
jgi:hypothetical protein